jgi:hypothetical protein
MLSLEVRKRAGGAEVHRVSHPTFTVGASSGNDVVVRARGVAGRHFRIFERAGVFVLDLYRGAEGVQVNGRDFSGGPIAPGDRISFGEATMTVLQARAPLRGTPVHEIPISDTAAAPEEMTGPATEVEFRSLRLSAWTLSREAASEEDLAMRLTDFLDRELPPNEWAIGRLSAGGFRALASTFLDSPAPPPRLVEEAVAGGRASRAETVAGTLTLISAPADPGMAGAAIYVREIPRLAARAVLFLEELVLVICGSRAFSSNGQAPARSESPAPAPAERPAAGSPSHLALRETDDLKRIVETVEKEVIDRAMKRLEGNQSRAAQELNISRGSLIAKLKEYAIPDYRYLRRQRRR